MEVDITSSKAFTSKFAVEDTAAGLGPSTAFWCRACSAWERVMFHKVPFTLPNCLVVMVRGGGLGDDRFMHKRIKS